mmetsp:Transcript_5958/g.15082  ORF Transcript_5958/g.15082 Transcript_5958/m.15082 type:complete len:529 (-) Transcript_5958:210-1796(-)
MMATRGACIPGRGCATAVRPTQRAMRRPARRPLPAVRAAVKQDEAAVDTARPKKASAGPPSRAMKVEGRLPVVGNAHQMDLLKIYEKVEDWHQVYGDIFEITVFNKTGIHTSNAEDIQQIFKDSDTFRKSEALLGTISEWLGNGLATESDIGKHAEMRRILNPAFRVDYIKGLSPVFGQIGSKLADDILSMGEHDIQDMAMRATIDIIGLTGFRYDFGSLDMATGKRSTPVAVETPDSPLDVASLFDTICTGAGKLFAFGFLPRAITPGYKDFRWAIGKLDEVIDTVLAERQAKGVKPSDLDLISFCVRAMEEHPDIMDSKQIRNELHTMLFAGSDTTANTLSWMFNVLSRNPDMQDRCAAEVDALFESDPHMTPDVLNAKLPYLTACFKETLRLFPAVTMLARVAVKDTVLEGTNTLVDDGALCNMNIWSVQRSPKYWRKPLEFRPERWLPEGLQEFGPVPEDAFVPFGGGSRICIGKYFAIMEGQVLAAQVLKKAAFEPVPGFEPDVKSMMTLTSTNGIWLKAVPR